MKNAYALLLAGLCISAPVTVFAHGGTCAAATHNFQNGNAPADSGNTCTDSTAGNYVAAFCGGGQLTGNQQQEVYQVTLTAPGAGRATSISITGAAVVGTTTTWTPTVYLISGTCANGGGCQATGTSGGAADISGVAAGTYFLVVGGSQLDDQAATTCGTYNITANGTLPVKLQQFSIQ